MQRFRVKGDAEISTWVEVMQRSSEGYRIRIIREDSWERTESLDFMSTELFTTCVKTGYFVADKEELGEESSEIA